MEVLRHHDGVEPGILGEDGMAHEILWLELFVPGKIGELCHRISQCPIDAAVGRCTAWLAPQSLDRSFHPGTVFWVSRGEVRHGPIHDLVLGNP